MLGRADWKLFINVLNNEYTFIYLFIYLLSSPLAKTFKYVSKKQTLKNIIFKTKVIFTVSIIIQQDATKYSLFKSI